MPLKHGHPSIPPAGSWTSVVTAKFTATPIQDGVAVNAEPLAVDSTPYSSATIQARKPSCSATIKSTDNADSVWICGSADDLTGAIPLTPGQFLPLRNSGDLANLYLAVVVGGDGVSINYA